MFKSRIEKNYNLELKIEELKKNLIKRDNVINKKHLDGLVNTISLYYKNQFKGVPNNLYQDEDKDFLNLAREDKTLLIELFDMNNLYQLLNFTPNYERNRFEKDYEFRRSVMNIALYETILENGKGKGAEYGLIFAKIFNLDLSIPMTYASYDGMFDERFQKFYNTYKDLGGSLNTYWLPNYFDAEGKEKYDMENLSELIPELEYTISKYKVNSKK